MTAVSTNGSTNATGRLVFENINNITGEKFKGTDFWDRTSELNINEPVVQAAFKFS